MTDKVAQAIAEISAKLDKIEAMVAELTGKGTEAQDLAEQFARAIAQGATAEELLERSGLSGLAGMEEALAVFKENRSLVRGQGNKVYNELCRLHTLKRIEQLERLRLGYDAEGSVARLAEYLTWDEVHKALQKFAIRLFNYKGDVGEFFPRVHINEKYKYFKLHYAGLEGKIPDPYCNVVVSFEGLSPYEAARAFREAIEPLAA